MKKTALVDGDIIRYQSAAVCDVASYTYDDSPTFRYQKDLRKWVESNTTKDWYDVKEDIVKSVETEPLEFCLHTVKLMIHSIMDKAKCEEARVFLTGLGNYRETIAKTVPYKGHRPESKPTHFNAVNEYLLKYFKAEVIEGAEADDALGYLHCANPGASVICTTDKDLLGVPGYHFFWGRNGGPKRLKVADYPYDEVFDVTYDEANKFFYTQLLTGDVADNIKGLKGIGPKRAEAILADCTTPRELYEECAGQYEQAGLSNDYLVENANLLWIQREKDVLWTPPKKQ